MKLLSSLMLKNFSSHLTWKLSWTPFHKWSPLFQWTWTRLTFPLQKGLPYCTAGRETWFTGATLIKIGVYNSPFQLALILLLTVAANFGSTLDTVLIQQSVNGVLRPVEDAKVCFSINFLRLYRCLTFAEQSVFLMWLRILWKILPMLNLYFLPLPRTSK